MTHFVRDNTSLSSAKVDRRPIPPGESAEKFIRASDWNEHRQALIDIQDYIRTGTVLNAVFFGATGDGVADDSTALTSAIAEMVSSKKRLWLPPGTYLLNSTVTIPAAAWGHIFGTGATIKFNSSARIGLQFLANTSNVRIEGVGFTGDTTSDDLNVNFYPALQLNDTVTDILVDGCTFDHCTPITAPDVITCRRLTMRKCYVHNQPNGVHPPADSLIDDCAFICDSVVMTRAQAIYVYASHGGLSVRGCRFQNITAQDIQIRGVDPHFQQKGDYIIEGCYFDTSVAYSIWVGSDSHPDVGRVILANNTFRNCQSSIYCVSNSAIIEGNHFEIDFEYSRAFTATPAITISTGVGLSGHYEVARGVIVKGNKFIVRHPWVGRIAVTSLPANNDTLTIGDITYTWKTTASAAFEIQIGADAATCATNLLATVRGLDGRATAPCNALRYTLDAWGDPFGATYGTTVGGVSTAQIVWIASGATYTLTQPVGTGCTLTAPVDMRQGCGTAISVGPGVIAPHIEGNEIDDFAIGIVSTQNVHPWFDNNVMTTEDSTPPLFTCSGNNRPYYGPGNRQVFLHEMIPGREESNSFADAFPIIECSWVVPQQMTNPEIGLGRTGVKTVGDMKAYAYLWYGQEISSQIDATTLRYRWNDGDTVAVYDGVTNYIFEFKRTSPGANQFNDADSLVALINGSTGGSFTAAYETYVSTLGGSDPKMLIKITNTSTGTAGNSGILNVRRYKNPTDRTVTGTYQTVPQSLLCGLILRDSTAHGPDKQYSNFYGGAASATKTFVHTPLANAERGVWVQGINSTSQALAPVVYQTDIVPGLGFYITHGAAAGTEKFFWRAN